MAVMEFSTRDPQSNRTSLTDIRRQLAEQEAARRRAIDAALARSRARQAQQQAKRKVESSPRTTTVRARPAPGRSYSPPSPRYEPPRQQRRVAPSPAPVTRQAAPKPKPKPKPPSLTQFLAGDVTYQQALRGGQRTLQDMLSDLARQRTEVGTSFEQTKEQMEENRLRELERIRDEFAARGLLRSSLFAGEQGEFQERFGEQLEQLEQGRTSALEDLLSQRRGFERESELAKERARQAAVRRRAEKYDIV